MEWSGVEWSGVEWSGVEWSGVEWSGVEWSGVERLPFHVPLLSISCFHSPSAKNQHSSPHIVESSHLLQVYTCGAYYID